MKRKRIKIIAPVGELPDPDPDLQKRINELPENATISDVFRVVSDWEPEAVKRFREMENTKKSGILHPICNPMGR